MKIGIDISQSVYLGTGVASYTRSLVKALLDDTNEDYILFGSSFGRRTELLRFVKSLPQKVSLTVKTYSMPISLMSLIWNNFHLVNIERFVGKIDIFHTSDWTEPPAKATKVTTIHDLVVYKYPQYLPEEIIQNQKQKLKWIKKESSAVITDSLSTKEDIIHYLNIAPDKIKVIPLGIGKEFFPRTDEEILKIKKKYRLENDYILCVGTREPRKNLRRIVRAYKNIKDTNKPNLIVVGNYGWGEDIGKQNNINILGYVSDNELAVLFSGAVGFIYPSLYEGFGLPVIEALSCGTVVVTSNKGSLNEIVNDKIAVKVSPEDEFEIANGIKKIINLSSTQRNNLVMQGIKHAKKFSWKITALETLKVYKSLI